MRTLEREMESPVYALARKSQAALELYLGERISTVSFLAHAYAFKDLADERTLNRVFLALKSEYQGFVDMGLVNADGRQVAYVGPYKLQGADYAGKAWLRDTEIKGRYLSNAILGYRGYPHLVVAVHRLEENGVSWTLRVATDTLRIQQVVSTVGPEHGLDPRVRALDVAAEVGTVLRLLSDRMESAHVRCEVLVPQGEDAPRPLGSGPELQQICLHLLENALDALSGAGANGAEQPAGGCITLTAATRRDGQGRDWYDLMVRDDGPGIAPEIMARRGHEIYAEAPKVVHQGGEHVAIRLAGVAPPGADLAQLERTAEKREFGRCGLFR